MDEHLQGAGWPAWAARRTWSLTLASRTTAAVRVNMAAVSAARVMAAVLLSGWTWRRSPVQAGGHVRGHVRAALRQRPDEPAADQPGAGVDTVAGTRPGLSAGSVGDDNRGPGRFPRWTAHRVGSAASMRSVSTAIAWVSVTGQLAGRAGDRAIAGWKPFGSSGWGSGSPMMRSISRWPVNRVLPCSHRPLSRM